jgi:hypothetical protein
MGKGGVMTRRIRWAVGLSVFVVGVLGSAAPAAVAETCKTGAATFEYTGEQQCYLVPSGVTLSVTATGGKGGDGSFTASGGFGAVVSGVLTVKAGSVLYVEVGAKGCVGCAGVLGGGGSSSAGSGGGASDVRLKPITEGTASLESRLLVAGGGGGGGREGEDKNSRVGAGPGGNAGVNANGEGGAGHIGGSAGSTVTGGEGGMGGTTAAAGKGGKGGSGFPNGEPGAEGTFGSGGSSGSGGGGGGGVFGGGGGGQGGVWASKSEFAGGGGGGAGSSLIPSGGTVAEANGGAGAGSVTFTDTAASPPTANITKPLNNKTFIQDKSVKSEFACAEGTNGPGLESCTDNNGGKAPKGTLNTSTLGIHFYTVTAKSLDGETGTASIRYAVVPAKGWKAYEYCGSSTGCGFGFLVDTELKLWDAPEFGESGTIETVAGTPTKTNFVVTSETGKGCVYTSVKKTTGYNSLAKPGNWECGGTVLEVWYAVKK